MSTVYSIACTDLLTLMARLKLATAKPNDYTPVLESVYFSVDDERVTAVSTDRYRLFMDSRMMDFVDSDGEPATVFTLPGSAADDFKRLGFAKTGEHARIEITDEGVTVVTQAARLSYPGLSADYPRVGSLMATSLKKVAAGESVEVTTGYNVDYLADFAKVRRAGGISKNTPLRVHQIPTGGDNFQLIATFPGTDFWALLMGVRNPKDSEGATTAVNALELAVHTSELLMA